MVSRDLRSWPEAKLHSMEKIGDFVAWSCKDADLPVLTMMLLLILLWRLVIVDIIVAIGI